MEAVWTPLAQALILALAGLVTYFMKKLIDWLDAKTALMDGETQAAKKEALKQTVVEFASVAVRKTAQLFVDDLKAKNGKLTPAERTEAFKKAKRDLIDMLKEQGIEVGREVGGGLLNALIESLVRRESVKRAEGLAAAAGNS